MKQLSNTVPCKSNNIKHKCTKKKSFYHLYITICQALYHRPLAVPFIDRMVGFEPTISLSASKPSQTFWKGWWLTNYIFVHVCLFHHILSFLFRISLFCHVNIHKSYLSQTWSDHKTQPNVPTRNYLPFHHPFYSGFSWFLSYKYGVAFPRLSNAFEQIEYTILLYGRSSYAFPICPFIEEVFLWFPRYTYKHISKPLLTIYIS